MNHSQIEPSHDDDKPQINERLWQDWLMKGREMDRIGAVRRVRLLGVILAIVIAVAVFQSYTT